MESTNEALKAARLALADTELNAPYDGIVAEKLVEKHQNVKPGESILRFHDLTRMEIVINLSERDINAITSHPGCEFTAEFDALPNRGTQVCAREYGTESDPQTQTYPVTLELDPANSGGILPGMTASVSWKPTTPSGSEALTVPIEAVFSDEAGTPSVWRVRPQSESIELVPVTTGDLTGKGLVVLAGLSKGDRILSAGVHFVSEGQRVRPMSSRAGE